jgi:hypothetical protein
VLICLIGGGFFFLFILGIVFRPGYVQGPGFEFWPGHQVVWVNLFLKKSKQRCFSKKKVNGLQPGFVGSPSQPAGSGSKTMILGKPMKYYLYLFIYAFLCSSTIFRCFYAFFHAFLVTS